MSKRFKKVNFTTPIGTLVYPKIDRVDEMNKDYRTLIAFGPEETAQVRAAIDAILKDQFDGDGPFTDPLGKKPKKWDGDPDLDFLICKSKYQPHVHDINGVRIMGNVSVPSGSLARLRLDLIPYEMTGREGVSARFLSAQIVKLGSGGHGFEPIDGVDGGFIAADAAFSDLIGEPGNEGGSGNSDFDFD